MTTYGRKGGEGPTRGRKLVRYEAIGPDGETYRAATYYPPTGAAFLMMYKLEGVWYTAGLVDAEESKSRQHQRRVPATRVEKKPLVKPPVKRPSKRDQFIIAGLATYLGISNMGFGGNLQFTEDKSGQVIVAFGPRGYNLGGRLTKPFPGVPPERALQAWVTSWAGNLMETDEHQNMFVKEARGFFRDGCRNGLAWMVKTWPELAPLRDKLAELFPEE